MSEFLKKDRLSLKLNAFGPSWLMQQIKFSKSIIFSLGPRKKSGTKDGKIFIPSFRNLHFSGDPTILQQTCTYKKKLKNSNLTYLFWIVNHFVRLWNTFVSLR